MEKLNELLYRITAINAYAKDCHYNFQDFGQHIIADKNQDELLEGKDFVNEVCYLGLGYETIPGEQVLQEATKLMPEISENDQVNLARLKLLVKETLVYIEELPRQTRGSENLIGSIAQDLQQLHGLLFKQVDDEEDLRFLNNIPDLVENGGEGSGDFGHEGRIGKVGGSGSGGRSNAERRKQAYDAFIKMGIKVKEDSSDLYDEAKKSVSKENPEKVSTEITIERKTAKALLLKKENKTFWVQKKWLREDGTLTPAGEKAFEKASTKEDWIAQKKEDSRLEKERNVIGHSFTKNWENEKSIGVDLHVAWTSSFGRRVRLFFPKSQIQANGNLPTWLVEKKMQELNETLPRGWFIEDSFIDGISSLEGHQDYVENSSNNEKLITVDDELIFEIEEE